MEITEALLAAGLSEGESTIYQTLLKYGTLNATKLKELTNIRRTTVYDYLNSLINKGLVNYISKGRSRHFTATDPEHILDYLQEKQQKIQDAIPLMKKIKQLDPKTAIVEVYNGKQGFKIASREILEGKHNYCAFGVDESIYEEKLPFAVRQHWLKEAKLKLKSRTLTSENATHIFDAPSTTYKYVPDEYFTPETTLIFGDTVVNFLWNPDLVIVIRSKAWANANRKHFELLWNLAKDKPKGQVKKIPVL